MSSTDGLRLFPLRKSRFELWVPTPNESGTLGGKGETQSTFAADHGARIDLLGIASTKVDRTTWLLAESELAALVDGRPLALGKALAVHIGSVGGAKVSQPKLTINFLEFRMASGHHKLVDPDGAVLVPTNADGLFAEGDGELLVADIDISFLGFGSSGPGFGRRLCCLTKWCEGSGALNDHNNHILPGRLPPRFRSLIQMLKSQSRPSTQP